MSANKTLIIGLTGGMGSGKSEAARHLVTLGVVHVDADAISRSLTAPGGEALGAIREKFGDGVFFDDGTLDRRRLGEAVFSDAHARHVLEAIIHPRVQRIALETADAARAAGRDAVLLDVPLLFETGMDVLCDETWTLVVGAETQLKRVMMRGLTAEQARARIDSQMSAEERSARSTRTINTDRPIERTQSELTSLYQQVLKRVG